MHVTSHLGPSVHQNEVQHSRLAAVKHLHQNKRSKAVHSGSCSFIKVAQMSFAMELSNSKSTRSGKLRTWGSGADIVVKDVCKDLKESKKKTHQLRGVNNWTGGAGEAAGPGPACSVMD